MWWREMFPSSNIPQHREVEFPSGTTRKVDYLFVVSSELFNPPTMISHHLSSCLRRDIGISRSEADRRG